jgi:uncharacterized BrkB/YihY/UPF0761 family membrane protein
MRQALGIAVFFGMIGVTVFGLVFTPVFYVASRWVAARFSKSERAAPWRQRGEGAGPASAAGTPGPSHR